MQLDHTNIWETRHKTGFRGDPEVQVGPMALAPGVRIRVTRNVDKRRGVVNGALATIVKILDYKNGTLIAKPTQATGCAYMLIHPYTDDKGTFLPLTYGYSTTMRRTQGATLSMVALHFDRPRADPGYAFVAASRVKTVSSLYHVGKIRQSDWLPVGREEDDLGDDDLRARIERRRENKRIFGDELSSDDEPEPSCDEETRSSEVPDSFSDEDANSSDEQDATDASDDEPDSDEHVADHFRHGYGFGTFRGQDEADDSCSEPRDEEAMAGGFWREARAAATKPTSDFPGEAAGLFD